jgi:restriction system protein
VTIPDFQEIMLPLLKTLDDRKEHSLREVTDTLAAKFGLTVEEQHALLPSGQQEIFSNRVGWARTYMKKAELIDTTQRGFFRITDTGQKVLEKKLLRIDRKFLLQFEKFRQFQSLKHEKPSGKEHESDELNSTPEEAMANAYQNLRSDLANDLLQKIKEGSPRLFENIVVDLLVRMGYGGSREDAARAVGKTGDEGIDGIINEDRLGLDIIYLQAKRWENTVSRPEIQKFAGALQGQRAKRGIFLTTSNFSKDAREFASNIENKIVLIDGETLVQLMIDYNLGVNTATKYEIKRIDLDYFTEE